jgi:hypothetical protein
VNFSSVSDRFICPDGNATFVADAWRAGCFRPDV